MACCCSPAPLSLQVCKGEERWGSHVSLLPTLYETVRAAPIPTVQMFLGSPYAYNRRAVPPADIEATRHHCQSHNMSLYCHCPYIANLAKTDNSRSLQILRDELTVMKGVEGACVLHIGKVGTIAQVAEGINQLQREGYLPPGTSNRTPFHLLLEVAAGQGTELGRSWEELRHLYEALDHTCVGLCIDTQHAFAAGMCDFQSHESVVQLFDAAQSLHRRGIAMIHLNDSKKPYRSQVDRHAPLGQGHIWYHEQEGLGSLLRISRDMELDLISETGDTNTDRAVLQRHWDQ